MFTKDFNHNYANNMVYSNSNLTNFFLYYISHCFFMKFVF